MQFNRGGGVIERKNCLYILLDLWKLKLNLKGLIGRLKLFLKLLKFRIKLAIEKSFLDRCYYTVKKKKNTEKSKL